MNSRGSFKNPNKPSLISGRMISRSFKAMLVGAFAFGVAEFWSQIWNIDLGLYYKDTEANRAIITNCKDLRQGTFKPTFYLPNATLQIIYGAQIDPVPYVPFNREQVKLPDHGEIALDWGPIHKSYEGVDEKKMRILIITHGLTGGSECNYIRHAVLNASRYGFRPVVYHNRGVNSELTTSKYHNHGEIDDIKYIIEHIQKINPEAAIYGMGISMGANMMSNYCGETEENCILKGFVSISNPYDLYECSKHIAKWRKKIYNYSMTQGFIKNLKKNIEKLQLNKNIDIEKALKCKTTREFDEYITRRLHGFDELDEYYKTLGCLNKVSNIAIPSLFIHSLDDPICE